MQRKSRQGAPATAGAVAAALLLAACGAGQLPPADADPSCGPAASIETLAPFRGPVYDYTPLRTPGELARLSELVVSGTVSAVREGRRMVYPANGAGAEGANTIVLVMTDVTVVRGQQPDGHDGSLYLELHGLGKSDPASYRRALPAGARAVAYLVPAVGAPGGRTDVGTANPAGGRPAGQALYLPAGPQGLALQATENNVVWPLIGARAPGCIADALPGGHLIGQ